MRHSPIKIVYRLIEAELVGNFVQAPFTFKNQNFGQMYSIIYTLGGRGLMSLHSFLCGRLPSHFTARVCIAQAQQ